MYSVSVSKVDSSEAPLTELKLSASEWFEYLRRIQPCLPAEPEPTAPPQQQPPLLQQLRAQDRHYAASTVSDQPASHSRFLPSHIHWTEPLAAAGRCADKRSDTAGRTRLDTFFKC